MAPLPITSPKPLVESNQDLEPNSSSLEKFMIYETRAVRMVRPLACYSTFSKLFSCEGIVMFDDELIVKLCVRKGETLVVCLVEQ